MTKYSSDEMTQQQNKKVKDNLSKIQWKGIMNLKSDNDIIIKESENGGSCVTIDETFYYDKMSGVWWSEASV